MADQTYNVIKPRAWVPVKEWNRGVPLEEAAQKQLLNVASLPFVCRWWQVMPDVQAGVERRQDADVIDETRMVTSQSTPGGAERPGGCGPHFAPSRVREG